MVIIDRALQLEAARRRAVPIRFNMSPVASFKSLSLSVAVLERTYCWYDTLRCDLELWPRDLDLWSLTLNLHTVSSVTWWNSARNLSEIEQSAADLLQFELWPYDLEHVPRVALCSGIVCTKFKLNPFMKCDDILMLIRHIMLWPWPLTRWPWTFVVGLVSRGHSLW